MDLDDVVKHAETRRIRCFFQGDTPVSELGLLTELPFRNLEYRFSREGAEVSFDYAVDKRTDLAKSNLQLTLYLKDLLASSLYRENRSVHLATARYVSSSDATTSLPQDFPFIPEYPPSLIYTGETPQKL